MFCIPIKPTVNLLLRCECWTDNWLSTGRSTAFLECLSTWQSWAVVVVRERRRTFPFSHFANQRSAVQLYCLELQSSGGALLLFAWLWFRLHQSQPEDRLPQPPHTFQLVHLVKSLPPANTRNISIDLYPRHYICMSNMFQLLTCITGTDLHNKQGARGENGRHCNATPNNKKRKRGTNPMRSNVCEAHADTTHLWRARCRSSRI